MMVETSSGIEPITHNASEDSCDRQDVPVDSGVRDVFVFGQVVRSAMPFAVTALAVLALIYTMYFAADLFLPLFFALFLSIMLRPLVQSMMRFGLPEAAGALLVIVALIGLFAGAATYLSGPATEWFDQLPRVQREIEAKLWPVKRSLEQAQAATEKIEDIASGGQQSADPSQVTLQKSSLFGRAFELTWLTLVQSLITLALTFFLLLQKNEGRARGSLRRLPWQQYHGIAESVAVAVRDGITRFLRISAIIYLSLGAVTAAAMYGLGMPNPLLWGALATVMGFMPYIGPVICFGMIALAALLSFDVVWKMAVPPLVYGALTIVEGYFITPAVLGRHLMLSPLAVFLSILVWTWVWGMPGALLALPILLVLTISLRTVVEMADEE